MFANQRGSAGLGSIVGVALVMLLSILGTGLMVKVYRDGNGTQHWGNGSCQVVCGQPARVRG